MKHNVMLTITSLLSILFMTFHLTDDIIRGMASGGVSNLFGVLILVVWLYGTLVLAERRSGYVIILLGSLLGLVVPVIYMMGKGVGVGGNIAKSNGAFFFVWTLIALGVTALFSASSRRADCGACNGASPGSPTTRTWKGPSRWPASACWHRFCLSWGFRCRSQASFEALSPNSCIYRCSRSKCRSGCGCSSRESPSPRGKKRTLEGAGQRGMKAGAQAIFIQRFA